MRGALLLLLLTACTHSPPNRHVAFVAKHATEATLSFSHEVEIISVAKPSPEEARAQIESQVLHLFGPMERAEYKAAPKEDHEITNVKISRKSGLVYVASYDYEGTIVVEKGPRTNYDVILPNNPATIYADAKVGSRSPCTDDHYPEESDFWYFWSPAPTYPKCRLEEGKHYQVVHGRIDRERPERKTTFPEYDRLAHKGEIRADVFFGMDEAHRSRNPLKSRDENAAAYRALRKRLAQIGFAFETWSEQDMALIVPADAELPFVEEASKKVGGTTLRVRMFFGPTAMDEESTAFHYFFRDALQGASLVIYDGHSGLGGHLDLAAIAEQQEFKINLPKNRYQIFFFNSCTSYTYYNALYFQHKRRASAKRIDAKGTKNLDILANGLETAFDPEQSANFSLIGAIHDWAENGKWKSYQKLAHEIDDDNLFTVNGDEDNPTKAR